MFEEICLVCGKHLQDDGRAYCSDGCQNIDVTSPSISSSSSAFSSPNLGCAKGGEVPALIPSALGTALGRYNRIDHSVSSSSASSTTWSLVSDNEDDGAIRGVSSERSPDGSDSIYEGSSKSVNSVYAIRSSALSYTRRPSGTNNRSTVPLLHRRTSSGSSSGHVSGIPCSVPNHIYSSTEYEEYNSDFGLPSRSSREIRIHARDREAEKSSTVTAKAKRTRNRASLPAYFSLLQMGSPPTEHRASPVSSLSGTKKNGDLASPPTPKFVAANLGSYSSTAPSTFTIHSTPRGRRREAGMATKRSEHSDSPSPSRTRHSQGPPKLAFESRTKGSVEQVFDWSPSMIRGRAAMRRNSSPPPIMPNDLIRADEGSRSSKTKTRGRARVDELDGRGGSQDAPGYGGGRSGLLDRERLSGRTATLVPR